jgi:serine/threonine protein kinase
MGAPGRGRVVGVAASWHEITGAMTSPYRTPEPPPRACKLGRYRLYGRLAPGRLGPVWLATLDPPGIGGPGMCVCLKECEGAWPFLRNVALLSHRNLCQIFELTREYLAMEYVQGGLLSQLPREPRLLAGIAQQVRAGIAAAHARGICHGALTADDVIVSTDGRAVVLGLGTAGSRPGAMRSVEHDLAACDELFGDAARRPLPEPAIGMRVVEACATRIQHERALGATGAY